MYPNNRIKHAIQIFNLHQNNRNDITCNTEQQTINIKQGYENAIKDYYKKQVSQLSVLISLLLGELTKGDRQKIMTICTIDVHSRDVVSKFIQAKIESASAFQWQSQLRHRWSDDDNDCYANICDAQFRYCHEYLGNTPRLVITPLTDRCYITLTQSLHLVSIKYPSITRFECCIAIQLLVVCGSESFVTAQLQINSNKSFFRR